MSKKSFAQEGYEGDLPVGVTARAVEWMFTCHRCGKSNHRTAQAAIDCLNSHPFVPKLRVGQILGTQLLILIESIEQGFGADGQIRYNVIKQSTNGQIMKDTMTENALYKLPDATVEDRELLLATEPRYVVNEIVWGKRSWPRHQNKIAKFAIKRICDFRAVDGSSVYLVSEGCFFAETGLISTSE